MTAQAAAPAARSDYTDEQLRTAWSACRRRTWPTTFEDAMADAQCARLVRLQAWLTTRAGKTKPAPVQPTTTLVPAPAPQPRFAALPPGYVDHKRAAAGDRDDD